MTSKNIYFEFLREYSKNSKYFLYYIKLIEKCSLRSKIKKEAEQNIGYCERHHIVPSYFGENFKKDKNNLVFLTPREHFIAHVLLYRSALENTTHLKKSRETIACFKILNGKRNLKFNSRQLNLIRKASSEASRERAKGNTAYLSRNPASVELKNLRKINAEKSRWVNNGIEEKFSENYEELVSTKNFTFGRLKWSKRKSLSQEEKFNRNESNLAKRKIRFRSGIYVNDGLITKLAKPEELEMYLNNNFVLGKIKIVFSEKEKSRKHLSFSAENNPKAKIIEIYDSNNSLKFTCNGNFKLVCKENNLPTSQLIKSYSNNGTPIWLVCNRS